MPRILYANTHMTRGGSPGYDLDIELRDVAPRVWRRVKVPADLSLADLHQVVQTLMRWLDHHLHVFEIAGSEYGPRPEQEWDGEEWAGDDKDITVAQALRKSQGAFEYVYDFSDEWRLRISAVAEAAASSAMAIECVAGARAAPPEDCGGPAAYQELIRTWSSKGRREVAKEMREWLPRNFDPDRFDVAATNALLRAALAETERRDSAPVRPSARATRRDGVVWHGGVERGVGLADDDEHLIAEVTLLTLFLGSWEERGGVRTAWKTVRFEVLDVLKSAGLVETTPARKSVVLTEEGVRRAESFRARVTTLLQGLEDAKDNLSPRTREP